MNWVGALLAGLRPAHRRRPRLAIAAAACDAASRPDGLTVPQARASFPTALAEVLEVIRAAGVVVGPHDEVLESTPLALKLGVIRGSRVVIPPILELVRQVRREQRSQIRGGRVRRGPGTREPTYSRTSGSLRCRTGWCSCWPTT